MTGPTNDSHPSPSDGPAQEGVDLYLPSPPLWSWFALLCASLPGAAMAWFYVPGFYFPWAAVLLFPLVAPLLAVMTAGRLFRNQGITLNDEGITVGRRTILWREVTKVCWPWPRFTRMIVILGQPPPVAPGGRLRRLPPRISLPPRPEVFQKVWPVLLRRCPSAAIGPRVASVLADPAKAMAMRRWPALVVLAVGLALLGMPWVVRHTDAGTAAGLALLLMALGNLVQVGGVRSHEPGARFSAVVAVSLWTPLLAATVINGVDVPAYAFDTVMVLSGVLCLAAGAALGLRWQMRALTKVAILTCAIGAAGAVWQDGVRHDLAPADITPLLAEGRALIPLPFVWSTDGDLAVEFCVQGEDGGRQHLMNVPSRNSRTLPGHQGFQEALGVNRQCVVRLAFDANQPALYVYRLADGREVRLSDRPGASALPGLCLSPDGRKVCWLDQPAGPASAAIHVYDLQTDRTETPPVAWPTGQKIRWIHCAWVDDAHLAIQGRQSAEPSDDDPCPPGDLHVLRVDLGGKVAEHLSCPRRFGTWQVSPDFRHAFASGQAGAKQGVSYVDLTTGRVTDLGDGDLPSWEADGRHAWRVARVAGGDTWLCRFDPANATWTRWLPIAPGSELVALTPRGGRALIQSSRRSWPLEVVDIASGRRQRLGVSLLSSFLTAIMSGRLKEFARVSLLSPDGRHVTTLTQWGPGNSPKVYLYTLPEDWTKAGPAEAER